MNLKALLAGAALLVIGIVGYKALKFKNETKSTTDYSQLSHWLCSPEKSNDSCSIDLDAVILNQDGSVEIESFKKAKAPEIDCFYVYPTVSTETTINSDLIIGEDEEFVVANQFARFSKNCRLFAPLYQQVTVPGVSKYLAGETKGLEFLLARNDVLKAFDYYIENQNMGRPFVLVGHSQGSIYTRSIMQKRIEGTPLEDKLHRGYLVGFNTNLPEGELVGADFSTIPMCSAGGETGCFVSYVSFNAADDIPENSRYGIAEKEGQQAACVNPAMSGSAGVIPLTGYHNRDHINRFVNPEIKSELEKVKNTDFVKIPNLLQGQCVQGYGRNYLAISINPDFEGSAIEHVGEGIIMPSRLGAHWGLHLLDVSLAQGDLIELSK